MFDSDRIQAMLDAGGRALLPGLLDAAACSAVRQLYDEPERFRSRVVMGRHGFGSGEYRYFDYPLPEPVETLRRDLYAKLAPVANRWQAVLGLPAFPAGHEAYLRDCRRAGQARPTPLVLRYGPGDYNRLHQDLYGELVFPLQVAVLLSQPGEDFAGGEFVLTEQKPRSQSRVYVVPLQRGDAVVFAVNERPVRGTRGYYRVRMRHGVSEVRDGERFTLGIIFHDAA